MDKEREEPAVQDKICIKLSRVKFLRVYFLPFVIHFQKADGKL